MQKYTVDQIDINTFQVIDLVAQREVCVCANYDEWEDAKERANEIARLLNKKEKSLKRRFSAWLRRMVKSSSAGRVVSFLLKIASPRHHKLT